MVSKRLGGILASAALMAGAVVAAPAMTAVTTASAEAFTCVIFANHSGGYSQADGCKASQYKELIGDKWILGPWKDRGWKSTLPMCYANWKKSGYNQRV